MLGMMGKNDKNHDRGAALSYVISSLLGEESSSPSGSESPENLEECGARCMRAMQAGDARSFTAALKQFIDMCMESEVFSDMEDMD
jgi:hypothetical protein